MGTLTTLLPRRGSYSAEVLQSFVASIAVAGLNVIAGVFVARLLGREGRGELAAIQAFPMIVGAVGQLGLHEGVIFFGGRDRENVGRYVTSGFAFVAFAGVPIVLLGAAIIPWFLSAQSGEVIWASQVYMLLLYTNAIHGISTGTARALHRISLWNNLRLLSPAMWAVVVLFFMVNDVVSPVRVAMGFLVTNTLLASVMVLSVRRYLRGHWIPDVSIWPRMLRYGLPVAAGATPKLLNERLDQLLIAGALPASELGVYAVAVSWSMLGILPAQAIASVALSKIASIEDRPAQVAVIRKSALASFGVSVIAVAGLGLATPFAIHWVFGEEFADAIPIAWIMLIAVFLKGNAQMLQVALMGVGRTFPSMWSQWSGLVLLLPAMLLLIPAYGVFGAAAALVVSAAATLLTSLFFLRKLLRDYESLEELQGGG